MSNKEVRQGVADAISDTGLQAYAIAPDRPAPPFAAVVPDAPYLTGPQDHAGERYEMTLVVRVVVRPGTNEAVMDSLDDAVSNIIVALKPQQWSISVSDAYNIILGNAEYPAIDVTITNTVTIN